MAVIEQAQLPYFFEGVFQSPQAYRDPLRDIVVEVELTAPSGKMYAVPAFWDGGRTWRFRVDAEEPGLWRYALRTSDGTHGDWHGSRSEFWITPYAGPNPIYRHGRLRVAQDGTHLVHRDGTPFFWLADTAWNALLKAEPAALEWYLAKRREQGFTAIQCVMTSWRGCPVDSEGEEAYELEEACELNEGGKRIRINPRFFRRIDHKIAAIVRNGLVPVLVILWALTPRDPGVCLPEDDAILLARYIVARYGAYRPVWFLGGDAVYSADIPRWQRIGRAVFGRSAAGETGGGEETLGRSLVTLHPAGNLWFPAELRNEPWLDFVGYQSGHSGDHAKSFAWIFDGPPAREWNQRPPKPVINLEPCYEAHKQVGTDRRFTAHHVRIACYYSLLVSPTAGVTYGHSAVWPWSEQTESPMNHLGVGVTSLWHDAVDSPGAASMTCLKHIMEQLPWWKLRPAPQLVVGRPEGADPLAYVAASMTVDGSLAVVYLPQGGGVVLDTQELKGAKGTWVDPSTAERVAAPEASGERQRYIAPAKLSGDGGDWLLVLNNSFS